VKSDGTIVAWGENDDGERDVPLPNQDFVAVSAGGGHNTFGLTRMATGDTDRTPGRGPVFSAGEREFPPMAPRLYATPNPSAGDLLIRCELRQSAVADLVVFNAAGSVVRRFALGHRAAGSYSIPWDGRDNDGRRLPAGVYLTRITTKGGVATGRLVVLGW
jgi:hypothetical protein